MVGRLVSVVLLVLASCSDSTQEEQAVQAPGPRIAWCGESGDWRVMLEALAPTHLMADARQSEESMLREQLPIDEDQVLLRLHLLGPASELNDLGRVSLGSASFSAFEPADPSWDPQQRILWEGVLRGLPLPPEGEGAAHRVALLHGSVEPWDFESGSWTRDGQAVSLERRSWSENQRRAYFDLTEEAPIDE